MNWIKNIMKKIQKSNLIFVVSTIILIVVPFAVGQIIKNVFPQKYALFMKLLIDYNTIIIIVMLLTFFVIIAYILNYKETEEALNIKEKKEIIEYLTNAFEYGPKLRISKEMCYMFKQKIQILNKQINSEDYRNYPISDDFFINFKQVNYRIENKILEVT